MPLSSDLSITLPPSISSSFWTYPDYRPGVNSLYLRLQSGILENETILSLINHRIQLEYTHAQNLSTPSPIKHLKDPLIPINDDSIPLPQSSMAASAAAAIPSARFLKVIYQETTLNHSNSHNLVASNLEKNISIPFGKWSSQHEARVRSSWEHVDAALIRFNRQKSEVEKLRGNYESKCRQADEAEDDARFAPSLNDFDPPAPEKFQAEPMEKSETESKDPETLRRRETLRQQFGFNKANKGRKSAPESTHPRERVEEFGGVKVPINSPDESFNNESDSTSSSFNPTGLSRSTTLTSYLSSTINRLNETPALAPIRGALGALNEPKHLRIRREAENLEKNYKDAVKGLDRNRCALEEILMEHFTLAGKWETDREKAVKSVLDSYQAAFIPLLPTLSSSLERSHSILSQFNPDLELNKMISDFKTSNSYRPKVEVFHSYYHDSTDLNSLSGIGNHGFGMNLVVFNRSENLAREELLQAEGKIGKKSSIDEKDPDSTSSPSPSFNDSSLPLVLSSLLKSLEKSYKNPNKWPLPSGGEDVSSSLLFASSEKRKSWIYDVPLTSSHRLRQSMIDVIENGSSIGSSSSILMEELEKLLENFDPPTVVATLKLWCLELDQSLITENLWDQIDSVYQAARNQEREGLKKLAEEKIQQDQKNGGEGTTVEEKAKEKDLKESESKIPSVDSGSVNVAKGKGKGNADQRKELKLDDELVKKIKEDTLQDLKVVLGKLPKIHLVCLDALINHLSNLVKDTPTDEPEIRYLNKLGLSLGRAIIRPPSENSRTISTKAPILLTMDLVSNYDAIFPDLISKKIKETESFNDSIRKMPIRKRTKPIDQRVSRSQMAKNHQLQQESFKALRQEQDLTLGAGNGIPIVPEKEKKNDSKPVTEPIVTSQINPSTASTSTEPELPTPLASRVLAGGLKNLSSKDKDEAIAEESRESLSIERTVSPAALSNAESSNYGSAKGDSSPLIQSPQVKPTSPPSTSIPESQSISSNTSTSNSNIPGMSSEAADQDKPLSNVARLSRQFGSSSSGAVRGPRPAGARAGRANATEGNSPAVEGSKRDSKDLRPDADREPVNYKVDRRRKSWTRSVQPSDNLVDEIEEN